MKKLIQRLIEFQQWETEHLKKGISEYEYESEPEDIFEKDISEYGLEIEDIVNTNGDQLNPAPNKARKCIVCGKIYRCKYDIYVCKKHFNDLTITKTDAKRIYRLTDDDLLDLKAHVRLICIYVWHQFLLLLDH